MTKISVLDLAFITQGNDAAHSFANSVDLAQHVEKWGYTRFWVAEHHNMVGIASAATSVVIAHLAGNTNRIRIGAGGIMLPNHSPLIIAEQFGTLATLFPDRIDLGLGRAPGTDQETWRALRRHHQSSERFPQDVQELQDYLGPVQSGHKIQAVPGADTNVPLWILGSSLFGAQLAAALGLPYVFAAHFAPTDLLQAIEIYRNNFKPSAQLDRPYVMVGVGIFAADNDQDAARVYTSTQQSFVKMVRGTRGQMSAPIDDIETYWNPREKLQVQGMLSRSIVGSPTTIAKGMAELIKETQADELIIAGGIYDHKERLRSYEIIAEAADTLPV